MSAGTKEPPLANPPQHRGKVSVRGKAVIHFLCNHWLVRFAIRQMNARHYWLSFLAFIVPSRRTAAV